MRERERNRKYISSDKFVCGFIGLNTKSVKLTHDTIQKQKIKKRTHCLTLLHNKYPKAFKYLRHEAACIEIISNKTENCGEKS